METIAKHRHARSSAQKVRLVADLIRGKKVSQALDILTYNQQESGCTGQESSGICHC
ncbi:50S ribosomal protein L22 [Salmonella enterica subsp. enterica]|nr:50S ribosomal protein L22 [Salmonella enterica subsp. enterica]